MNLISMTIPENPHELAHWLERQLVGGTLGQLVAELKAAEDPSANPPPSMHVLLGSKIGSVLSGGLGCLDRPALQRFLKHPGLLKELQELVLVEGGTYWARLALQDQVLNQSVERDCKRLSGALSPKNAPHTRAIRTLSPPSIPFYRRPATVSLATAAALLLVIYGLDWAGWIPRFRDGARISQAVAWGWARPGAIPERGAASAYYDQLAADAEEWFREHPDDRLDLALRLGEFRLGCSRLLLDPHDPLKKNDGEEAWLVLRCQRWADRLDRLVAELESGDQPVEKVRQEADKLVRRVVLNLRSRADHLRSLESA